MERIDWGKIKFICLPGECFIEGAICKCEFDFGAPKGFDNVEENCGLFIGLTNKKNAKYTGDLPRESEETCLFAEFNIYFKDEKINEWTYDELIKKLKNT